MKKLKIGEKNIIWLKHGELVNESFRKHTLNKSSSYKIKDELFFFHSKDKPSVIVDETLDTRTLEQKSTIQVKKRKRKRLPTQKPQNEIQEQSTKVAETLQVLREVEKVVTNGAELKATDFERCWEEIHNFPKFKGANLTFEFQRFSFGEQTYLIPPQCQFYNYNITNISEILDDLKTYDLIVLDPPWRNKYIRRLKRHKQELAYHMLDNEELQRLPISKLTLPHSLVVIWCTNAEQHQRTLIEEFLPAWNLRLLHTLKWFKINTSYELIGNINNVGNKQPFEMLYIACHKENKSDFTRLKKENELFSIPSIVHSHKPPILEWLREYLPENPQCLEFFARYLQPHFTCIGMEVLKLMDERLYRCTKL